MMAIMAAHGAPYVAQLAPNKWKIMAKGFQKALDTEGPCFINTVSACTTEWKFDPKDTINVTDLATDSLMFPIYEIIDGHELNILYRPKNVVSVEDYLAVQGRYKHLFKPENRHVIEAIQKEVDEKWAMLQRREEARI
jgi:pyruvate ferredoxin oxidoreductase beta subunit